MKEIKTGIIGPDEPDTRDLVHVPEKKEGYKPIDLRKKFPVRIRNQGRTNACGGYSGAVALEFLARRFASRLRNVFWHWSLSANEVYWQARRNKKEDRGVFMRDLMKALKFGAPQDILWPDNFSVFNRPSQIDNASRFIAPRYERISIFRRSNEEIIEDFLATLSSEELPILFATRIFHYDAQRANRTGYFRKPSKNDFSIGGHAMVCVGWKVEDDRIYIIIQNSWGPNVGNRGIFYADLGMLIDEGILLDAWVPVNYR